MLRASPTRVLSCPLSYT
uniref:Uncharacterized protein n=1 Tax=Arundo donax TaxID=35708 RepID=A0A0A8YJU2_ARUDO